MKNTNLAEELAYHGHQGDHMKIVLALALQTKLPLWSNDNDFGTVGIEWHTAAELLRKLGTSKG